MWLFLFELFLVTRIMSAWGVHMIVNSCLLYWKQRLMAMVSCPSASTLLIGMGATLSSLPIIVKNIFAARTWLENVRFFLTSSCLLYLLQSGFNEDNISFTPRSWSFAFFHSSFEQKLSSRQLCGARFKYAGKTVLIKHAFAITWRTSTQWTVFATFGLLLRNTSVCDPTGLKYEPAVSRGVQTHLFTFYIFPSSFPAELSTAGLVYWIPRSILHLTEIATALMASWQCTQGIWLFSICLN